MKLLNDKDQSTIINGLQIAREQYRRNVDELMAMRKDKPENERAMLTRLAEQFRLQSVEVETLIEQLEEHDGIALHNHNDMLRQTYERHL